MACRRSHSRLPMRTGRSSTRQARPCPTQEAKAAGSETRRPAARALTTMAMPMGCSELLSADAATERRSAVLQG
eukprot:scaffold8263_cov104-Isochrysis_galbana.AAC.13